MNAVNEENVLNESETRKRKNVKKNKPATKKAKIEKPAIENSETKKKQKTSKDEYFLDVAVENSRTKKKKKTSKDEYLLDVAVENTKTKKKKKKKTSKENISKNEYVDVTKLTSDESHLNESQAKSEAAENKSITKKKKKKKKLKSDESIIPSATVFVKPVNQMAPEEITAFFTSHGLAVKDIRCVYKASGYAFVDLVDNNQLSTAVALSGKMIDGNKLSIHISQKTITNGGGQGHGFQVRGGKSRSGQGRGGPGRGGPGRGGPGRGGQAHGGGGWQGSRQGDLFTMIVNNLPYDCTTETLREHFPDAKDVRIATDKDTGDSRGFAFADFHSTEARAKAIKEKDALNIGGRSLFLKEITDSNKGGGGERVCFKCGEEGHISRDCPKGGGSCCFNCGENGHMSRECPEESGTGRGRGGPRGRGGLRGRGAPSGRGRGAMIMQYEGKKITFDD